MKHENLSDDVNKKITFAEEHGIIFRDLRMGDVLEIATLYSVYNFKMLDPPKGLAVASGSGKHFPSPTRVHLHGSNFGGSMIKLGWVGIGTWLELKPIVANHITCLSMTTGIKLNGKILTDKSLQEE